MIVTTKTIKRGPASFSFDGTNWFTTEREITRVDDWRETALGRVNFGYVHLGPSQVVPVTDKETTR